MFMSLNFKKFTMSQIFKPTCCALKFTEIQTQRLNKMRWLIPKCRQKCAAMKSDRMRQNKEPFRKPGSRTVVQDCWPTRFDPKFKGEYGCLCKPKPANRALSLSLSFVGILEKRQSWMKSILKPLMGLSVTRIQRPRNCTPAAWQTTVPTQITRKSGFAKNPSNTLISPKSFRQLISLKSCIKTNTLKMNV